MQCSMPVFEGLLPPPHDTIVQDLLFTLSAWHAYAKLRLHTETTLGFLDITTRQLGYKLRKFKKITCAAFVTRELPKEAAARERRKASKGKKKAVTASKRKRDPTKESKPDSQKTKVFNLSTYKLHALGDYVQAIRHYGTADNYNTQVVCTFLFYCQISKSP